MIMVRDYNWENALTVTSTEEEVQCLLCDNWATAYDGNRAAGWFLLKGAILCGYCRQEIIQRQQQENQEEAKRCAFNEALGLTEEEMTPEEYAKTILDRLCPPPGSQAAVITEKEMSNAQ